MTRPEKLEKLSCYFIKTAILHIRFSLFLRQTFDLFIICHDSTKNTIYK